MFQSRRSLQCLSISVLSLILLPTVCAAQFSDVSWSAQPNPIAVVAGEETTVRLVYRNSGPDSFQPTAPLGRVTFGNIEIVSVQSEPAPGVACSAQVDPDRGNIVVCSTPSPVTIAAETSMPVDVVFVAPAGEATIVAEVFPPDQLEPKENNVLEIPVAPIAEGSTALVTQFVLPNEPVGRGGVVRVDVVVTNQGPGDVAGFDQTTNMPHQLGIQLEHIETVPEVECELNPPVNFRCYFGPLAVGAQATIIMRVPVPDELEDGEYLMSSRALTETQDHAIAFENLVVAGEASPPEISLELACADTFIGDDGVEYCAGRVDEGLPLTLTMSGDAASNLDLVISAEFLRRTDEELSQALNATGQILLDGLPPACGAGLTTATCTGLTKTESDLVYDFVLTPPRSDRLEIYATVVDDIGSLTAEDVVIAVAFPNLNIEWLASESVEPNLVVAVDVLNASLADSIAARSYALRVQTAVDAWTRVLGDCDAENLGGGSFLFTFPAGLEPAEIAKCRAVFRQVATGNVFELDLKTEVEIAGQIFEDTARAETTSITVVEQNLLTVTKSANTESPARSRGDLAGRGTEASIEFAYEINVRGGGDTLAVLEDYIQGEISLFGLPADCKRRVTDSSNPLTEHTCLIGIPSLLQPDALAEEVGVQTNEAIVYSNDMVATDAVDVDVQGLEVTAFPSRTSAHVGEDFGIEIRITNVGSEAMSSSQIRTINLASVGQALLVPDSGNCEDYELDTGGGVRLLGYDCDGQPLPPGGVETMFMGMRVVGLDERYPRLGGFVTAISETHGYDEAELQVTLLPAETDVQIINNSSDLAKRSAGFDVYLDGQLVSQGLSEGAATSFLTADLTSARPILALREASSPAGTDPLAAFVVDLFESLDDSVAFSSRNIFLLTDTPGDTLGAVTKTGARSTAEDPSMVDVFIVHANPTLGEITGWLSGAGISAQRLGFGETSDYATLDPGPHFLHIRDAATGEQIDRIRFDVADHVGEAVALVLSGQDADGSLTLTAFDGQGSSVPTPVDVEAKMPSSFVLHAPYPNPSNSTTQVRFDLPATSTVDVQIFDLQGRLARTVSPRSIAGGFDRAIQVDGSNLSSGVYLYRITAVDETGSAGRQTAEGRIVVVR